MVLCNYRVKLAREYDDLLFFNIAYASLYRENGTKGHNAVAAHRNQSLVRRLRHSAIIELWPKEMPF